MSMYHLQKKLNTCPAIEGRCTLVVVVVVVVVVVGVGGGGDVGGGVCGGWPCGAGGDPMEPHLVHGLSPDGQTSSLWVSRLRTQTGNRTDTRQQRKENNNKKSTPTPTPTTTTDNNNHDGQQQPRRTTTSILLTTARTNHHRHRPPPTATAHRHRPPPRPTATATATATATTIESKPGLVQSAWVDPLLGTAHSFAYPLRSTCTCVLRVSAAWSDRGKLLPQRATTTGTRPRRNPSYRKQINSLKYRHQWFASFEGWYTFCRRNFFPGAPKSL